MISITLEPIKKKKNLDLEDIKKDKKNNQLFEGKVVIGISNLWLSNKRDLNHDTDIKQHMLSLSYFIKTQKRPTKRKI